jgi:hypothetical protein
MKWLSIIGWTYLVFQSSARVSGPRRERDRRSPVFQETCGRAECLGRETGHNEG